MKPLITSNIERYDNIIYDSGIVKFSDYIIQKYDKIHEQLYNDALNKFLVEKAKEENISVAKYKRINNILEYKADEYYMPSKVLVISKKRPYKKAVYDLDKYWNNHFYESKYFVGEILNSNGFDDNINYEITHIDYVKGLVVLESKITGEVIETTVDHISSNTPISDELILKNTFGS